MLLNNPSFCTFQRFPASTVKNISAGELFPSDLSLCNKALPLPEIILTFIPVSFVNSL